MNFVLGGRLKDIPKELKVVATSTCHFCGEEVGFGNLESKRQVLMGLKAACHKCDQRVFNEHEPDVIIELPMPK